jgi:hypothetical protein
MRRIGAGPPRSRLLGALLLHRLRLADEDLSFFSTVTTFGTAVDITLAELTLEAFYPADAKTKSFLVSAHS